MPNTETKVARATKAAKPAPAKKKDVFVTFESRREEPTMFPVAGIKPVRNFVTGRLEYLVPEPDVERFTSNHFVLNGRITRKPQGVA